MSNIEMFSGYISYLLFGMGVLAFMVAIVVQVIKEMPGVYNVPTSFVALLVSLVICILSTIILCDHLKINYTWQIATASVMISFVVYLLATGGWERVIEIWKRMRYPGGKIE